MSDIPARLKKHRLQKNISQPELGEILGVSKQTISNWEKGHRTPDAPTISRLAAILGVTTDYLLGRTDHPHETVITSTVDGVNYTIGTTYPKLKDYPDEYIEEFVRRLKSVGFDVAGLLRQIENDMKSKEVSD